MANSLNRGDFNQNLPPSQNKTHLKKNLARNINEI